MRKIDLFNIEKYTIDTSNFNNVIHDGVTEFEEKFADYVGAKHACGVNSATNAIFLALLDKNTTVTIPTMIPPVVANAILTSRNKLKFNDDRNWVGSCYTLHEFNDYKIIDSAQQCERDIFKKEANPEDLMIFSFYPTKPVGSIDGGMIVSNDKDKIDHFRKMVLNGMSFNHNNWERKIEFPGYKFYLNSVQAFIASKNLDKLDEKNRILTDIRNEYNSKFNLDNTSGHLYRINSKNRAWFIEQMKSDGITCGIHYECLHNHPAYKSDDKCHYSELLSQYTVSIPFHEKLTEKDVEHIIKKTEKYESIIDRT